jgi:CheY-like chemotaxis protein
LVQYFGHLKRKNQDPSLDETVSRIGKSLDSMQDLLDRILEVSKLMMGSVKPSPAAFDISKLVDHIDAQLRPTAEGKGLQLETESVHCYVHTDEVLLERILRNITLNAVRYTRHGKVLVRARRRGALVVVKVLDTGIGIPKDQRDRIFEAFYQLGNTARDRRRGLGLGLAIVRQLSELLQIPVRLRSKEGKGSVFSIQLPVASRKRVETRFPQINDRDFTRDAYVVLIDDNAESLEATDTTLTEFGCHVVSAASGPEAIERLQGQEFVPHLVISDYRLADGETGLDAIGAVIANQRALYGDDFAVSALVLSGDTAPAELQRVQQAGIRMLHKPVQPEDLWCAVNAELRALATGVGQQP